LKKVTWTDGSGKNHISLIRDADNETVATTGHGLSLDPPDVWNIDWNAVKLDLHNELVNRGLLTHADVVKQQSGVSGAVLSALRRRILTLYLGD